MCCFFILSLWSLVCILYSLHTSVQTRHISSAQWPHVASGYCTGQCSLRFSFCDCDSRDFKLLVERAMRSQETCDWDSVLPLNRHVNLGKLLHLFQPKFFIRTKRCSVFQVPSHSTILWSIGNEIKKISRVGTLIETKSRLETTRGSCGWWIRRYCSMVTEFLFEMMKSFGNGW